MFWKDALCQWILKQDYLTYDKLINVQSTFPSIRVKTADANGKIPLIQLEEKGTWIKPKEWAANHQASLKQRLMESQQRVLDVTSDPGALLDSVRSLLTPADCHFDDDLKEIARLEEKLKVMEVAHREDIDSYNSLSDYCFSYFKLIENLVKGGSWPQDFTPFDDWIALIQEGWVPEPPKQS